MKCIAAVVMVAFVAVARAGLIYSAPWAYTLPHTTVVQSNSAPKLVAAAATPFSGWSFAPSSAAAWPFHSAPYYVPYGAPFTYSAPISYSAPIAYSAPGLLLQKEARYLAANRGAIHEAPLPGHEYSQQQLNLEPAAGTV
ncbi:adult cuticle protein 1-like [Topomyia yanbarensis]|uniref:adult cuticle protein 1-like n=1 Tax=Topomyia yanbarensis TaxID=2498891 RepID=UPI00273A8F9E|nr:adult cuticle protein 1-like [Topomyia yanbarensis]